MLVDNISIRCEKFYLRNDFYNTMKIRNINMANNIELFEVI